MISLNLRFSFVEITSSLEKMGYVIVEEERAFYYGRRFDDADKAKVWVAYLDGQNVTDSDWYSGLYGDERIERLFEKELCKKLLELF